MAIVILLLDIAVLVESSVDLLAPEANAVSVCNEVEDLVVLVDVSEDMVMETLDAEFVKDVLALVIVENMDDESEDDTPEAEQMGTILLVAYAMMGGSLNTFGMYKSRLNAAIKIASSVVSKLIRSSPSPRYRAQIVSKSRSARRAGRPLRNASIVRATPSEL